MRPSPDKPFEGIDIVQHVAAGRTLYWRKPRGTTLWKDARQGALKFVGHRRGEQYQEFLFDLSLDPAEKNDLSQARPADFERLRRLYHDWEERVRRNRSGRPK